MPKSKKVKAVGKSIALGKGYLIADLNFLGVGLLDLKTFARIELKTKDTYRGQTGILSYGTLYFQPKKKAGK